MTQRFFFFTHLDVQDAKVIVAPRKFRKGTDNVLQGVDGVLESAAAQEGLDVVVHLFIVVHVLSSMEVMARRHRLMGWHRRFD